MVRGRKFKDQFFKIINGVFCSFDFPLVKFFHEIHSFVFSRDEEPVDLQLPEQEYVELNVPELQSDAPKIEFKEKVITSLKDFVPDNVKQEKGVSAFKKRKFNPKGNARQRLDND